MFSRQKLQLSINFFPTSLDFYIPIFKSFFVWKNYNEITFIFAFEYCR